MTDANHQGGKLQTLQSLHGTTSLQYLAYTYNPDANITTITDHMNGPQIQSFGYNDGLNRLTSAGASGGSGGTYGPESYVYDSTTGNLSSKAGVSYAYNYSITCGVSPNQYTRTIPHAVSSAGSNSYSYDCDGNMASRTISGTTYTLTYDAESRLVGVTGGGTTASFTYDGDGNRVSSTINGVTTSYIGNTFEWTGIASTMVNYYYAGSVRCLPPIGGRRAARSGRGAVLPRRPPGIHIFGCGFQRQPDCRTAL